jgi:transketolase C-terminal domain/subunit
VIFGERDADAFIVSSGRGVHEALAAARECAERNLQVSVIDMPSIDAELLTAVCTSGKLVCLAEQNNGYILQNLLRLQSQRRQHNLLGRVLPINTLGPDGRPQFIHSGTYEELVEAFRLTPSHIASAITDAIQ